MIELIGHIFSGIADFFMEKIFLNTGKFVLFIIYQENYYKKINEITDRSIITIGFIFNILLFSVFVILF
ncbi:MAG: hypothetical protein ABIY50_10535 [Ignavibacteria bacterium]